MLNLEVLMRKQLKRQALDKSKERRRPISGRGQWFKDIAAFTLHHLPILKIKHQAIQFNLFIKIEWFNLVSSIEPLLTEPLMRYVNTNSPGVFHELLYCVD